MVLEALAGHLGSNRMSEWSLAQRPRFCHRNAALAVFLRKIYGHWWSDWSYGYDW